MPSFLIYDSAGKIVQTIRCTPDQAQKLVPPGGLGALEVPDGSPALVQLSLYAVQDGHVTAR